MVCLITIPMTSLLIWIRCLTSSTKATSRTIILKERLRLVLACRH
ncbi:Uncharacterised protein [Vibrio cholerae]|nr:Uncharacterised protein [Vibrio cholerae]